MEKNVKAFGDYLLLEKKYSKNTVQAYVKDLVDFENFIVDQAVWEDLASVEFVAIRNWVVVLVDSGLESKTVNRKMASLKAFYKFLLKSRQIAVNPMLKYKALKVAKNIQIPFSEKELKLVLEEFDEEDGFLAKRDRLIVELFYVTGIRRSELIELKLNSFDLTRDVVKVLGKRNKERLIPLLPKIKDQIKEYLKDRSELGIVGDDYFFVSKKGLKLSESFVYRLINVYFSKVSEKVKKSPHILRHTFATHLLNNGAELNSIKELLGHSSLASTQVYTHSSLAELQKVYKEAHPRNKK
ncbi:tyrosine-type recombinase/integrase [Flavobacterium agrisoli]|uniref:Tyrosine recombinase XerC n=1 Tax=Flavobacterium agrisoli TaxID=2793066 RepID=A0A934UJY2_9FLAO|nr:tyrosine-type recombinase/integrase [Flavobacterium agrisoli]MBK0370471.1 tyrosine-type recombinase/integrase [Flavobacterium agrisoli]